VHFGYLPAEQAVTEVAEHVRKFWDPRMKRRLLELVDSETSDLEPVALAASSKMGIFSRSLSLSYPSWGCAARLNFPRLKRPSDRK